MKRSASEGPPLPILEHPGDGPAVIEPSRLFARSDRIPDRCVLCFFKEVIAQQIEAGALELLTTLPGEGEPIEVHRCAAEGRELAVAWPGIGASFAASILEELIALGARRFVCAGGAGVLDSAIPVGQVIVPTAALRDEGTSYHYQRQGRFSRPHPEALRAIGEACRAQGIDPLEGPTWTTDGVYRETPAKVRSRREEGCLTVEMEAAAFFAVARFRGVVLGQVLYGGDDVGGDRWRHRQWITQSEARQRLYHLAVDACLRMA